MDAVCSVSLYAAITHSFMTFMMSCYGYETKAELVVGWLEDELMRVFEVPCGRCCVRRESKL